MDILFVFLLVCFSPLIIFILIKVTNNMNKEYMRKEALKTSKLLYNDAMNNFNRMSIVLSRYKDLTYACNNWIENKDLDELKEVLNNEEIIITKKEEEIEKIKQEAISFLNKMKKPLDTEIDNMLIENEYCMMMFNNTKWYEFKNEDGHNNCKELYNGILYFTNKRLILKTDTEIKDIEIDIIENVEICDNGIELKRIEDKSILLSGMSDIDVYKAFYFIKVIKNNDFTITKVESEEVQNIKSEVNEITQKDVNIKTSSNEEDDKLMQEAMSFVWNIQEIKVDISLDKEKFFMMIENLKLEDTKLIRTVIGNLYITNNNVVFKTINRDEIEFIRIKNITEIEEKNNGFEIKTKEGKNIIISNLIRSDIFKVILLIKSIQNGTIKNLEKVRNTF